MNRGDRIIQILSWTFLFAIQVFFNLHPTKDEWLRVIILSTYMLLTSIAWIRFVENKPLLDRLNVNQQTTVLFTYSLLASVLVIFTKQDFSTTALITGGSMILPIFEELYFRAFLLGSISHSWPSVNSMSRQESKKFLKEGAAYLILTSLGFALVHDDIIHTILTGSYATNYPIILLRLLFGFTIGGLYYYTRNYVVTSTFHIIYNLTYLISRY